MANVPILLNLSSEAGALEVKLEVQSNDGLRNRPLNFFTIKVNLEDLCAAVRSMEKMSSVKITAKLCE